MRWCSRLAPASPRTTAAPPGPRPERPLLRVEPQPRLPGALVRAVAREAVVGQYRPHVALEVDGGRGRRALGGEAGRGRRQQRRGAAGNGQDESQATNGHGVCSPHARYPLPANERPARPAIGTPTTSGAAPAARTRASRSRRNAAHRVSSPRRSDTPRPAARARIPRPAHRTRPSARRPHGHAAGPEHPSNAPPGGVPPRVGPAPGPRRLARAGAAAGQKRNSLVNFTTKARFWSIGNRWSGTSTVSRWSL